MATMLPEVRLANKETGPHAIKVTDENKLTTLRNIVLNYWVKADHKKEFFPAPQPVSLERRDLSNLVDMEYLVCVKSDGMRFLMVCYSGETYMVDRAFKFYTVKQNFKIPELYGIDTDKDNLPELVGGIFDGELVKNNQEKWQYVIHDCVCMEGKDISQYMFPQRYAEVTRLVEDVWVAAGSEFRISGKQFFPFRQLRMLDKMITENKLDHKTDGLIFTPKDKKIGTGTQYDLYKWKPRKLHTFDFKIQTYKDCLPIPSGFDFEQKSLEIFIKQHGRVPGRVAAYVNNNGKHELYASIPPHDESEKFFLDALSENCPGFIDGNIVECEYDEIAETFKPIKIRADKTHPNSKYTIRKTLNNITENITVEELIGLSEPQF